VGRCFPEIQASVTIDDQGVRRLHRALSLYIAPINRFYALAYGRACDEIPGSAFRDLMLAIAGKPGGNNVALAILSLRLFSERSDKRETAPEVLEGGCALLSAYQFVKQGSAGRDDHDVGLIAHLSLRGDEGVPVVRRLVREMKAAINRYEISAGDQNDLLTGLLKVHPSVVLDEMFSGDATAQAKAAHIFRDFGFRQKPLDVVPDETLLRWCHGEPAVRYDLIAASATLFRRPADDMPHEWTPLVSELLARAPDRPSVLEIIVQRLHYPMSWSGSLATKLESRLKLLEGLPIGEQPELVEPFKEAKLAFQRRIAIEQTREADENRNRSTRFE
jgi:hypothetical protein